MEVSAVVPQSDLEVDLRELVLKYKIHNCRPGRFKKDAKHKLCKYGYPYALLEDDGLHDSGIRYNYARYETEDRYLITRNC